MPTTVSDTAVLATAAGLTDVTVTRVWPSITTVTATFSDVFPDQIGDFSPNVARRAESKKEGYPFCALVGALVATENCFHPSEEEEDEDDELCQALGGLVNICGLIDEDGNLQPISLEDDDIIKDLNIDLESIKNLKAAKRASLESRSFLESYSSWCNSFDDSGQAQEQDPYTQKLLAEGAASFFGVEIETDEQRASWLKIGKEFHNFYCGEGGARDLWKLISTVDPWNELAAATSVPITLVWEGGDAVTPTATPTPTPEPETDALDAIKKVGLETSEDDETPQQERYFDFDSNTWVTSLLTVHETPDAAVQTGYIERGDCANCERGDCPHCGRAAGISVDFGLLGGFAAVAGFFMTFVM